MNPGNDKRPRTDDALTCSDSMRVLRISSLRGSTGTRASKLLKASVCTRMLPRGDALDLGMAMVTLTCRSARDRGLMDDCWRKEARLRPLHRSNHLRPLLPSRG